MLARWLLMAVILLSQQHGVLCAAQTEEPSDEAQTTEEPAVSMPEEPVTSSGAASGGSDEEHDVSDDRAAPAQEEPSVDESATQASAEQKGASQEQGAGKIPVGAIQDPQTSPEALSGVAYEDIRIDTADLAEPKGNWVIKRIVWEYAVGVYEQMWQIGKVLADHRIAFLHALVDLDKKVFVPFYRNVGVGQGELAQTIESLLNQLKEQTPVRDSLSEERQKFLTVLQEQESSLNEVKKSIETITELDKALNDALVQLMEQIDRADRYQMEGWTKLKEIAHELNDRRAQELYEEMVALLESMRDILRYSQQEFAQYFMNLQQKAADETTTVMATVTELRAKGVDFKEEFAAMTHQSQEEAAHASQQACEREIAHAKSAQLLEQKQGWWASIGTFFNDFFWKVTLPFRYLYHLFF